MSEYGSPEEVREYNRLPHPNADAFAGLVQEALEYQREHAGTRTTVPVVAIVEGRVAPPLQCFVLRPEIRSADRRTVVEPMYVALPSGIIATVAEGRFGRSVTDIIKPDAPGETRFAAKLFDEAVLNLKYFGEDFEAYTTWAAWPQATTSAQKPVGKCE